MARRRSYRQHVLMERVDRLPETPGVYLFKGIEDEILYVGKAINLRARVRQYFLGQDTRPRMHRLMRELQALDVSLATSEQEALLLESRLIRQHKPRYNIALKGGLRPVSLRLDLRLPFPRLDRGEACADGATWFGPMQSAWRADRIQELLERRFKLRTCSDRELARQTRPCLQFQLKRCPAPCAGLVSPEEYALQVQQVVDTLQGGEQRLVQQVRLEMQQAADALEFEQAAWLRDRLMALEGMHAHQAASVPGPDRDVIGLSRSADEVAIAVVPVRWGRQQQTRAWYFPGSLEPDEELLTTFLLQKYEGPLELPPILSLPFRVSAWDALSLVLQERSGRGIQLQLPPDEAGLDKLAEATAQAELTGASSEPRRVARALQDVQKRLKLPSVSGMEWVQLDLTQGELWRLGLLEGSLERLEKRHHRPRGLAGQGDKLLLQLLRRWQQTEPRAELLLLEGGRALLKQAAQVWQGLDVLEDRPLLVGVPSDEQLRLPGVLLPGRRNLLPLPQNAPARWLLEQLREQGLAWTGRGDGQADKSSDGQGDG